MLSIELGLRPPSQGPIACKTYDKASSLYGVVDLTPTQPEDFERQGMSWWFEGPRSGHISIFNKEALALASARHGYRTVSFSSGTHIAFGTLPKAWGLTALQS
jgi:hypothetical protein